MSILKKSVKLDAQVNIKVSQEMFNQYQEVKARFKDSPWEFSLQPSFSKWLNTQLIAAQKVLAAYEGGRKVSVTSEFPDA